MAQARHSFIMMTDILPNFPMPALKKISNSFQLLDKVMKLEPVSFNLRQQTNDSPKKIGFIAQEFKKQFPELVSVMNDSASAGNLKDLHMMDYSGVSVIAIKAIQELRMQLDETRKEVEWLKLQYKNLQDSINTK
jgi:hypothetical protein